MTVSRVSASVLLVLGLLVAACSGSRALPSTPSGPSSAVGARMRAGGAGPRSNVTRGDYAGSAACRGCHEDVVNAWMRSPMHRMTRTMRGAEVRGPFDGTRWPFKQDAVVLDQRDGERFVRIEGAGSAPRTYRVTRVVGGRTREDYVGVDVASGGEEMVLPVSYVFATRALRYKGYSVMVHERGGLRAGPVWSQTCIFCHNTVPEMDRMLGPLAGRGAKAYQGEQVDRLLPEDRRAHPRVVDDGGFGDAIGRELTALHASPPSGARGSRDLARQGIAAIRSGFDGDDLVEEGIGCEACHGGAAEHVRDPRVHPTFVPVAPWLDAGQPAGPAEAINRACARCHQVLFSRYPFTWEGGRRDAMPGGSHINSGEGRDFLLGGCSSQMSCTTCHDPHALDAPASLAALATPAGNATCTKCHAELAATDRLRAHAHHDPAGAGGSCVACHMPRKNMGLDGKLTRYHRIGSPTDPARVLGDRPLECALCHPTATVAHLVDRMEAWWPKRYPRQRLEELYGSLDAGVMAATLARGKAHEQAVAIGVLAEARAPSAAALIAPQLANEYPLVREWARRALDALGAPAPATTGAAPTSPAGPDEDPED